MTNDLEARKQAIITGGEGDLAQHLRSSLETCGWFVTAPGRNDLDVANSESVRNYFADLGPIDLLINNAGIKCDRRFHKLSEADWDAVLEVNLKGVFRCSQAASQAMCAAGKGHIINIGSYSAFSGPIGQTNYAAAKAGLIGLTQSLAQEYGGRNIQANVVLPGYLKTKFTKDVPDKIEEVHRKNHALKRFNTADDAAIFIATLAEMQHVSGQVFQLDSRIRRWT